MMQNLIHTALPPLPQKHSANAKPYHLEEREISDNEDDDIKSMYQDIGINEFQDQESESDEDLESATRNNAEKTFLGLKVIKSEEPVLSLSKKPEVIDDFIRNFLSSKNLLRTLDTFQNEWYEHQQLGKLTVEDTNIVPDVYKRNQDLSDAVQKLRIDVENYKEIASKARATYDKLRKERDFHRMHHKRVVQEKGKLINDIKKLKEDYDSFEPTLKQIQHKYEIAMKEKMLTKLERDKLASKVVLLDTSLKSARDEIEGKPKSATPKKRVETKEASFPIEDRKPPAVVVSTPNLEKLHQTASINAHSTAISSIKFHPTKQIIATTSDDKTWKMFAFPTGDAIMTAQGHRDWISDCDFHPNGTQIATSSGDKTVKIWDFIRGTAIMTLSDHTSAVWSCAYHYTGDFLVSASMDHTSKLWDLKTGKCKQTLRGHVDSVNCVGWQPYANIIHTGSSDKTISLWDARTGLCTSTLYGHLNSINSTGDKFASCDADGVVKFWDIRNTSESESVDFGPYPVNKIAFDPSGVVLSIAGNDGVCKLFNTVDKSKSRNIASHEGSLQCALWDKSGEYLVTAGTDGIVKIFQ